VKVGDLVQYQDEKWCPLGLITGFDKDDDPIVMFIDGKQQEGAEAYYRRNVKVISESR